MKVNYWNQFTLFPLPAKNVSARSIENNLLIFFFLFSLLTTMHSNTFYQVVKKEKKNGFIGSFTYSATIFFLFLELPNILFYTIFFTNKPTKDIRYCGSATK